jgi:hypothetical protein
VQPDLSHQWGELIVDPILGILKSPETFLEAVGQRKHVHIVMSLESQSNGDILDPDDLQLVELLRQLKQF